MSGKRIGVMLDDHTQQKFDELCKINGLSGSLAFIDIINTAYRYFKEPMSAPSTSCPPEVGLSPGALEGSEHSSERHGSAIDTPPRQEQDLTADTSQSLHANDNNYLPCNKYAIIDGNKVSVTRKGKDSKWFLDTFFVRSYPLPPRSGLRPLITNKGIGKEKMFTVYTRIASDVLAENAYDFADVTSLLNADELTEIKREMSETGYFLWETGFNTGARKRKFNLDNARLD